MASRAYGKGGFALIRIARGERRSTQSHQHNGAEPKQPNLPHPDPP
jgi:hypothetical protein